MTLHRTLILPVLGLMFVSRGAMGGQSHYLLVKTIDNFQSTDSVQPPSLKTTASAKYMLGSQGDNAVVSNSGSVDSDSGLLVLKASASQSSGTATIDPKAWLQVTRLEEILKPGPTKPTSVTVQLDWSPAGSLTQATPGTIDMEALLRVGTCGITITRTTVTAGATAVPDKENNDCLGIAGATASAGGSILRVTLTTIGSSLPIETQISAKYSWSGPFVGTLLADVSAKLSIEVSGGTLVATSPTFLKTAAGSGDAGTIAPPANDAGIGDSDAAPVGSSSDGGTSTNSASTSDDGGCNVSNPASVPSALAPLVVLGAFLFSKRRRSI